MNASPSIERTEARENVAQRIASARLLTEGYHFCNACERITQLVGEQPPRCCHCKSTNVRFCQGIK